MQKNGKQARRLYAGLPIVQEARTWAEIDLAALCSNYRVISDHVARGVGRRVPIICVIKADAYGHGAGAVARALMGEGCRTFAVSCIEEGEELRAVCREEGVNADILILGYTRPALAARLAQNDLITSLVSAEYARELAACAAAARVTVRTHIKLDTGMNRIGFPVRTEAEVAQAIHDIALIRSFRGLRIEGLFTHFARADEESGPVATGLTAVQRSRFVSVRNGLAALGLKDLFCHVCNSAAAIRFPDFAEDAVRVGISLYGCEPSDVLRALELRPVMRLRTLVSHVHNLPAGETVGYGGTFRADTERRIATLPIGYADGFLRAFGGASVRIETAQGEVSVPIVGRVCMDQCTVDVTDTAVAVGDKVTLLGSDPEDIRDLARRAGTIPYEIFCLISARVPRLYL